MLRLRCAKRKRCKSSVALAHITKGRRLRSASFHFHISLRRDTHFPHMPAPFHCRWLDLIGVHRLGPLDPGREVNGHRSSNRSRWQEIGGEHRRPRELAIRMTSPPWIGCGDGFLLSDRLQPLIGGTNEGTTRICTRIVAVCGAGTGGLSCTSKSTQGSRLRSARSSARPPIK